MTKPNRHWTVDALVHLMDQRNIGPKAMEEQCGIHRHTVSGWRWGRKRGGTKEATFSAPSVDNLEAALASVGAELVIRHKATGKIADKARVAQFLKKGEE